jgi:hypothetical protein
VALFTTLSVDFSVQSVEQSERTTAFGANGVARLQTLIDRRQLALDARDGTHRRANISQAHITECVVELIDGGVWANNLVGVAAIEAIGMLGWAWTG